MSPAKGRASAYAFWGSLAVLFFSQAVYLGLSLASLQKLEQSSRRHLEAASLERLGRRLETVVELGVPLAGYRGLEGEARRAAARSRSSEVAVVGPFGEVLTATIEEAVLEGPFENAKPREVLEFASNGRSWRAWPLFDRSGRLQGLALLSASERLGLATLAKALAGTSSWRAAFLALVLSAALTGTALRRGSEKRAKGELGLSKLRFLVLAPFLLGQAAFSFGTLPALFDLHVREARQLASELLSDLAVDLDHIRSMGVEPGRIGDLGRHLDAIASGTPVIGRISVNASGFRLSRPQGSSEEGEALSAPLNSGGAVLAWLSGKVLRSARIDLALDNLALTLVSAILLMELVRVLPGDPFGRKASHGASASAREKGAPTGSGVSPSVAAGIGALRPLAFGVLLACDLSLSFIPLKAASLSPSLGPFWRLVPESVLLGLPISAEMAAIGAVTLFAAKLSSFFGGDKALMRAGLLAASLGAAASALAEGPLSFAMARGLLGLGYGAFNMASHYLAASGASEGTAGEAMGDLASGFFSGGLCGCLIGGLLADRLGFDPVLWLAAALLFLAAFFAPAVASEASARKRAGSLPLAAGLKAFLTGRSAFPLVLLSVVPVSAAMVGIVNFFLPLHMASMGYGPSMTSRLHVMMSLMIISFGPAMGRIFDNKGGGEGYLALAGLGAAMAGPTFLAWPALGGALAGMALMGLASVATEAGYPAYALKIPETRKLGQREALGLLSGFTRAGQMCGSLLIGAAWGGWGLWGLIGVGLALALSSGVFFLVAAGRSGERLSPPQAAPPEPSPPEANHPEEPDA
jgi:MFS family permease